MKKFLHFIHWRYLKHHYHEWKKDLSHKDALQKFLHTKNGKLAVIMIIAAVIPLTVLGVQQTQNIAQFAAEPTDVPKCDGSANYKADPNPVNSGEFVTFSKTDGTDVTIDTNHFGNGYDQASCVQEGPNLKCKTKSRGSGNPVQYHKWAKYPGGTEVCWYAVAQAPTVTGSGATSTPRSGPACSGTIKHECTFDNKPRLVISWDLRGVDTGCKVEVVKDGRTISTESTKCNNNSGVRVTSNVENGGTYALILSNGQPGCNPKNAGAVQKSCDGGSPTQPPAGNGSPTATPKPGQATNTPVPTTKPGDPTNTPAPSQPKCEVHLDSQSSCTSEGNIRLTGKWNMSANDPGTCKVTLFEGSNEVGDSKDCKDDPWDSSKASQTGERYKPNTQYTLQIDSDLCQTSSPSITTKSCNVPSQAPAQQGTQVQALWYSLQELLQ